MKTPFLTCLRKIGKSLAKSHPKQTVLNQDEPINPSLEEAAFTACREKWGLIFTFGVFAFSWHGSARSTEVGPHLDS
jgi:hypothetical protein